MLNSNRSLSSSQELKTEVVSPPPEAPYILSLLQRAEVLCCSFHILGQWFAERQ